MESSTAGGGATAAPPTPTSSIPPSLTSENSNSSISSNISNSGLSHSAPLRVLASPTSHMAKVYGAGLAVASKTSSGAAAAVVTPRVNYGGSPARPSPLGTETVQQQQQVIPPSQQQQQVASTHPSLPPPTQPSDPLLHPPPSTGTPNLPSPPPPQPPMPNPTSPYTPLSAHQRMPPPPTLAAAAVLPPMIPPPTAHPPHHISSMNTGAAAATAASSSNTSMEVGSSSSSSMIAPSPSSAPLPAPLRPIAAPPQPSPPLQPQPPPIPPSSTTAEVGQQQQQQQQQAQPTMSSSIEAEVDAFLSGPSRRVDKILSPPPRPKRDDKNAFGICKVLVNRRAWGEVMTYTEDILKNTSADDGGYANLYSSLVNSAASSSDATTTTTAEDSSSMGSEELTQIQKDTVHMIQWRLTGLLKLKRYRDLEIEVIKLGLLPSGVNKTTNKTPDWIPYGLKIAAAQSLLYTGTAQSCIDALYSMRTKLSPPPSPSSFTNTAKDEKNKIWINRINATLSNTFMRKKEWRLALSALDDLLHNIDHSVDMELETTLDSNLTPNNNNNNNEFKSVLKDMLCQASRIEVYSRQGRILLQVGALPEAELRFEKARTELVLLDSSLTECDDVSGGGDNHENATVNTYLKSLLVRQAKTNVTVNDGLYMFANEQYAPAMDKFDSAVQSQRQIDQDDDDKATTTPNLLLDTIPNGSSIIHCFDENGSFLLSQSLNNMALCALYSCQMIKAVTLIESLIREDPTKYLTETLAFNLCTLYELGSDNEKSGRKKKVLQAVAERFSLHDVGSESFRIS